MHARISTYRRLATALVLAVIPLAAAPLPVLGPPAICHPIDIGEARSLPWRGGHPFDGAPDYDVGRTVDDTLAILKESSDTLVHMETIRRATIYLTGMEGESEGRTPEWRQEQINRLVSALQTEARAIQARAEQTAPDGLRLFDYGYLLAAVAQSGRVKQLASDHASDQESALSQAALLRPDDGAVHLGYALATYGHGGGTPKCYAHLERAVALATDPDGLLRRNLVNTMGRFLGAESYDDLAAKVSARKRA
ncbi:MAG TPA: hypothetical protein VFD43_07780 [Planctomycetota bacterium]|nr:hypothetical protein [Planctomycetota bacterium]